MLNTNHVDGHIIFCFQFTLFLFCYKPLTHTKLCSFFSWGVYYWSMIRFPPDVDVFFIIFMSCLLLIQYFHVFSIYLLKGYDSLFPHRIICCGSEENNPGWLLNYFVSEDKHHTIGPDLLYLDIQNYLLWYCIDVCNLDYIIDLGQGKTCLGVVG